MQMDKNHLELNNQICFPIYSVSRLITQAYNPLLKELGVTYPQYLVLLVLWEQDNIKIRKISKMLMLNYNTISPLLKRMENNHLIERHRSNTDERSVVVSLTEKGTNLKDKAQSIPFKLLSILTDADVDIEQIIKMRETLNDWIDILNVQKNSVS
jgi:DNA-binding MarR family transcriptional regulator